MSETQATGEAESSRGAQIKRIVIALVVVAVILVAFKYFNVRETLQLALDWIDGLGPTGPIVFAGVYILCCVFLISGAVLTAGAGALFGLVMGTLYVSVASTLGATTAFLVGRYFARDWVAKKIQGNPSFKAIDEAVAEEGWKIVALTRLSPAFPFVFLNYAFGLTQVKLLHYVLASWIAMLPGTVMYVYIGYLGRAAAGGAGQSTDTIQWSIRILGFAATVVVTVFVTKIAKRALDKKIDEPAALSNA